MATKKSCVNEKAAEKRIKEIYTLADKMGIAVKKEAMPEILVVIDAVKKKNNIKSDSTIFNNEKLMIACIKKANERTAKKKEKEKAKTKEVNYIGTALIRIADGKKRVVTKSDATVNQDILYIYPNNAQANNVLEEEKIELDRIINPKKGVKTDVRKTLATVRINSTGDKNKNAVGLVVKVNAQNEEGHWITREGLFQDNDKERKAFNEVNSKILDRIARMLKKGDAAKSSFTWNRTADNNYEVSTKGDSRFSAFKAVLKPRTIVKGKDVGGMTIEKAYQTIFKKSGKNGRPKSDSYLNVDSWISNPLQPGDPMKSLAPELQVLPDDLRERIAEAKVVGGRPLTDQEYEDFSYYMAYLPLWEEWAGQNPELIEELKKNAEGKTITDQYASTRVSQARALTQILNGNDLGEQQEFKEVYLPEYIAAAAEGEEANAGLPEDFAKDLMNMIEDKLGVHYEVVPSNAGENIYGLHIITKEGKKIKDDKKVNSKAGIKNKSKEKTKEEEDADAKEAKASLEAENPTEGAIGEQEDKRSLITKVWPDIAERRARVRLFADMFSQYITNGLTELKNNLNSKLEEELTDDELLLKEKLDLSSDVEQRAEYLKLKDENGVTNIENIITTLKTGFEISYNLFETDISGMSEEAKNAIVLARLEIIKRMFEEENSLFGDDFQIDIEQSGIRKPENKQKRLLLRTKQIIDTFGIIASTPNLFDALVSEAANEIAFRENVLISTDYSSAMETHDDTKNDTADTEADEGVADQRSGIGIVKYKMQNPTKSLSVRMKVLLSNVYAMKYDLFSGGVRYDLDDLGRRTRMSGGAVYYLLMSEFAKMTDPREFWDVCDKLEEKYPWFSQLREQMEVSPEEREQAKTDQALAEDIEKRDDLRNEFYRSFRKVFMHFIMIDENGQIVNLNKSFENTVVIDNNVLKNYEGRIILGPNSIYTATGQKNEKNIAKLNRLLNWERKADAKSKSTDIGKPIYKTHPLYWALIVLSPNSKKDNVFTVENVREALKMLRGESAGHKGISLETILNNIGIDTRDMNLESILPYISDKEWEYIENAENTREELLNVFTAKQMESIRKILSAVRNIVSKDHGFKGHLVNDCKSHYLVIATNIASTTEGFTQFSFRHGDKERFSFAAPDFICDMVNTIRKGEEKAKEFIDRNYGRFDFFRGKSGRWRMPLLEDLYNDSVARNHFEFRNVLSIGGNENSNLIGKVDSETLLHGLINSFFLGTSEGSRTFGWYRSTLFSDTDAMYLFKAEKFVDPTTFKDIIVNKLVSVFDSELKRITAFKKRNKTNPNDPEVENFNDKRGNAGKFQFFQAFYGHEDKIIRDLEKLRADTSNSTTFSREKNKYIKALLNGTVAEEFEGRNLRMADVKYETLQDQADALKEELSEDFRRELVRNHIYGIGAEEESRGVQVDDEELTEDKRTNKEREEEEKQRQLELGNTLVEMFFYNDYFTQSQIIAMTFGDLAYAKNIRDFVKRAKQSYVGGERGYFVDENGAPIMERAMYVEDIYEPTNTYSQIKEIVENSQFKGMDRAMLLGGLAKYKRICTTDGQSLRTLKSFKTLLKGMGGKWTPRLEAAYKRITSGEITVDDFMVLWNQMKPFMLSQEDRVINGRHEKVIVQHKNSEYVLVALFSTLNTALNKSPLLQGMAQFMEKNNIDVIHFHSVVKLGYHSGFDLGYNHEKFNAKLASDKGIFTIGKGIKIHAESHKQYAEKTMQALEDKRITQAEYNRAMRKYGFSNAKEVYDQLNSQMTYTLNGREIEDPNMIKEFPLNDYIIVQPSDDHFVDQMAVFGSQLRNIMPADLPDGFTMDVKIKGKKHTLNREQAVHYYNMLIVDQLLDAFKSIGVIFKSPKSLETAIQSLIKDNPKYGDDVKAALELNEDGTGFRIPFNSPTLTNKIEDILYSLFKNRIQRQHINGGNAVLVSNVGLSDKLEIKYKTVNGKKVIDYIPCYLPAHQRSMYKDFLERKVDNDTGKVYWTINFEELEKHGSKEMLEAIGYRIPTENKFSIMPLRVEGFMPISMGSSIMLPSDIITMSGTDFDIDKLFIMLRTTKAVVATPKLLNAFVDWIHEQKEYQDVTRVNDILHELTTKVLPSFVIDNNYTDEDIVNGLNHLEKFIDEQLSTGEETDEVEEQEEKKYKLLKQSIYRMAKRSNGLTAKDIERLEKDFPLFKRFIDDQCVNLLNADIIHDKPMYIVERDNSTWKEGEDTLNTASRLQHINDAGARKRIRDNMLIDMIWGILTTPEGSAACLLPATYDTAKKASRQQMIRNDRNALREFVEQHAEEIEKDGFCKTIRKYSTEELEAFYDKYSLLEDPNSVQFHIRTHRNLMDGNDLIGIFALSSSMHYKFQFANLKIAKKYRFRVKFPGQDKVHVVDEIDPVYSPFFTDENGKRTIEVGRNCAELQTASPDNGKDPVLGYMGINQKNAARVNLLVRLGFDLESVGTINTSDDLVKYGESIEANPKGMKEFVLDIERLEELSKEYRLTGKLQSAQDRLYAAQYSKWMESFSGRSYKGGDITIEGLAKDLDDAKCFGRSDSPNGAIGISTAEAIHRLLAVKTYMNRAKEGKLMIEGMDKVIDENLTMDSHASEGVTSEDYVRSEISKKPIPRLQAFYTLGIRSAFETMKGTLPTANEAIFKTVEKLAQILGPDALAYKSGVKTIRIFLNELTTFLTTKMDSLGSDAKHDIVDKRNYYIHDFPMKFNKFLNEKDNEGKFIHQEIRDMTFFKMISNESRRGIKFYNIGGKITPEARKYFLEDLESLLLSKDPDVQDFGYDLYKYSFYNDGLNFGSNNYGRFFSTVFIEMIPGYIQRLREMGEEMTLTSFLDKYLHQFVLNHPELMNYTSAKLAKNIDDVAGTLVLNEEGEKQLATNEYARGTFRKFIKVMKDKRLRIYELEDDTTGNVTYRETDFNKTNTIMYDATIEEWETPKFSDMMDRGVVVGLDELEGKKEPKGDIDDEDKEVEGEVEDADNGSVENNEVLDEENNEPDGEVPDEEDEKEEPGGNIEVQDAYEEPAALDNPAVDRLDDDNDPTDYDLEDEQESAYEPDDIDTTDYDPEDDGEEEEVTDSLENRPEASPDNKKENPERDKDKNVC